MGFRGSRVQIPPSRLFTKNVEGMERSATSNTADDPQSSEWPRYPPFFIQLGTGGVGTRAGLGATRWAGVDAGIEVGNWKLVRFLRTISRLLTFIGCSCTMAARAAAS